MPNHDLASPSPFPELAVNNSKSPAGLCGIREDVEKETGRATSVETIVNEPMACLSNHDMKLNIKRVVVQVSLCKRNISACFLHECS